MARRIIIETDLTCEHGVTGRNHPVKTNERKPDGSAVVVECLAGTEVRVLDPGEFVLIEKVDGEWPDWAVKELHGWAVLPSMVVASDLLDALARGEQ